MNIEGSDLSRYSQDPRCTKILVTRDLVRTCNFFKGFTGIINLFGLTFCAPLIIVTQIQLRILESLRKSQLSRF